MALGLTRQGASPGGVVAFMTAAQSAGLDSFTFTYGILGARVAFARLAGAAVLAMTAGLACEVGASGTAPSPSKASSSSSSDNCCKDGGEEEEESKGKGSGRGGVIGGVISAMQQIMVRGYRVTGISFTH